MIALLVQERDYRWLSSVSAVVPVLLLIAMLVLNLGKADSRSDRVIHQAVTKEAPVFYIGKRPFSGQFYSKGQAVQLNESTILKALPSFYLIGKNDQLQSKMSKDKLSCVHRLTAESNRSLYYCDNKKDG
ncbi:hypothetical protein JCM19233_6549 [Vibrio astriarenae]|nr:hypothetical protein JCM19233_6549 [Vibrio sp. C7]